MSYGPAMPNVAERLTAAWGRAFSVVEDPEGARQVVGLRVHADAGQAEHGLLAVHHALLRLAGDYGPRSVDLPAGPTRDEHQYSETFGAKVRFRRSQALLRLPAGVLAGAAFRPATDRSDLAWRVRSLLTERLGRESTALANVSRTIAVHPRTLQRSLADEGLSFGEILDCVRRQQARSYLLDTDLPLAEISARLGFAEQAVFSRCARRWWGAAPSRMRPPPAGEQPVPAEGR
jgi:AraC-like DNA-binding protein